MLIHSCLSAWKSTYLSTVKQSPTMLYDRIRSCPSTAVPHGRFYFVSATTNSSMPPTTATFAHSWTTPRGGQRLGRRVQPAVHRDASEASLGSIQGFPFLVQGRAIAQPRPRASSRGLPSRPAANAVSGRLVCSIRNLTGLTS